MAIKSGTFFWYSLKVNINDVHFGNFSELCKAGQRLKQTRFQMASQAPQIVLQVTTSPAAQLIQLPMQKSTVHEATT
jgi:hypothetical protein